MTCFEQVSLLVLYTLKKHANHTYHGHFLNISTDKVSSHHIQIEPYPFTVLVWGDRRLDVSRLRHGLLLHDFSYTSVRLHLLPTLCTSQNQKLNDYECQFTSSTKFTMKAKSNCIYRLLLLPRITHLLLNEDSRERQCRCYF